MWLSVLPSRSQRFDPWVSKINWKRKWRPTPVFLPRKSHGQRSLVGYSPLGNKRFVHDQRLNNNKKKSRLNEGLQSFTFYQRFIIAWLLSYAQLFLSPQIVAHQAPLLVGFLRQQYWSGSPFPSPGDLLDPGSNLHLLPGKQILYN